MRPIERLFERESLPRFARPAALAKSYGGEFGLARPLLYANFVSSADGWWLFQARAVRRFGE
jgi:hypothetical protein